jgi:hypothetical protein
MTTQNMLPVRYWLASLLDVFVFECACAAGIVEQQAPLITSFEKSMSPKNNGCLSDMPWLFVIHLLCPVADQVKSPSR